MVLRSCSRDCLTCGWTLLRGAKRKAEVGWKKSWGGAWTSSNVRANRLQRKF